MEKLLIIPFLKVYAGFSMESPSYLIIDPLEKSQMRV